MADDIVTRLAEELDSLKADPQVLRDAIDEIERLRDELAAWQATVRAHDALAAERADEIERLRSALDAGRALADQLAVALAAQGSASFDEDTNLNIKRLALDAFKKARRG